MKFIQAISVWNWKFKSLGERNIPISTVLEGLGLANGVNSLLVVRRDLGYNIYNNLGNRNTPRYIGRSTEQLVSY